MDISVNKFTADVGRRGVAKPYMFACLVTLPKILLGKTSQLLSFRISHASIPQRSLMTVDQRYYGPVRRIPYAVMYQPLQTQILLSDNMLEREIIMSWQDLAISGGGQKSIRSSGGQSHAVGAYDASYFDDIVGSIEIMQFAESPGMQQAGTQGILSTIGGVAKALGFDPSIITSPFGLNLGIGGDGHRDIQPTYKIKLHEVYPSIVQDVNLDWGSNTEAMLSTEFWYHHITEQHIGTSAESVYGFEKLLRDGVGILNRFAPVVSLFRNQGIAGGIKSATEAAGAGPRNTVAANKIGLLGV